MRIHRRWSSCAIVLAALSVVSCADGQFGQVMQNVGKSMAKGMCAEGRGTVSTAPEFCLYIDDIQVGDRDSRVDVVLKAVNRTGQPLHLGLAQIALSTSNGSGWTFRGTSGMAWANGSSPLSLEPGGEGVFTIGFVNGQWGGADTTLSMNGELGILKIDSRGQPAGWFGAGGPGIAASRGFNFSRVGLMQQQPAQPLQQKASSVPPLQNVPTQQAVQESSSPSSNPADPFDIVGIRLGSTVDEARRAIKKHDPSLTPTDHAVSLRGVNNSDYTHAVSAGSTSERIDIAFSSPPNSAVAEGVERTQTYAESNRLLLASVEEALLAKYGKPSLRSKKNNNLIFTWLLGAPGASDRVIQLYKTRDCETANLYNQVGAGGGYFLDPASSRTDCGKALTVMLVLDGTNNLVLQMKSVLIDNPFIEKVRNETAMYVRAREAERAGQQGKPKL